MCGGGQAMGHNTHDDARAGFALMAAYIALQNEVEPRRLLLAAKATRSIAPMLARSLIAKARRSMCLRRMLEPDQQSA